MALVPPPESPVVDEPTHSPTEQLPRHSLGSQQPYQPPQAPQWQQPYPAQASSSVNWVAVIISIAVFVMLGEAVVLSVTAAGAFVDPGLTPAEQGERVGQMIVYAGIPLGLAGLLYGIRQRLLGMLVGLAAVCCLSLIGGIPLIRMLLE